MMELSNTLTVIGILISVIFGSWGIIVTFMARTFGEITFFIERTIALVDSIAKRIPELNISYHDKPASTNLVLLRGTFVNTGTQDIAPAMVETPACMQLPAGYSWLHTDIVSKSSNVEASVSIEGNDRVILKTGLLCPGEFIRVEALAELSEEVTTAKQYLSREKLLFQNVSFSHRIANVQKIKSRKPLEKPVPLRKWLLSFGPGLTVFCFFIFIGIVAFKSSSSNKLVFPFNSSDNKTLLVEVIPKNSEVVTIKGIDNSLNDEIAYTKFLYQLNGPPILKYIEGKSTLTNKLISLFIICFTCFVSFRNLYKDIKERQFQNRIYKTYSDDVETSISR